MSKKDLIDEVYAELAITKAEIRDEWIQMKKERLVYCVSGLSGWVGDILRFPGEPKKLKLKTT